MKNNLFCYWLKRSGKIFSLDIIQILIELCLLPVLYIICLISRKAERKIDVGFGPYPLLNNVHHKKALRKAGYTSETFVFTTWFITDDFDINLENWNSDIFHEKAKFYYMFIKSVFRYKSLMLYFNGGPLGTRIVLRHFEPYLYQTAGVKTILMPYGGDIQLMCRSLNLLHRHANGLDYPLYRKDIRKIRADVDQWTIHADHIIAGCEWMDCLYAWDTLMLGHFSIDTELWKPSESASSADGPLKLFHAPNHLNIKGSGALIKAVEKLKKEGCQIDFRIIRGVSNEIIRKEILDCDLVADQFVLGWYALFAIESMALGKPVLCSVRPDLLDFYQKAGLLEKGELPLIETDMLEIEDKIRWACENREKLPQIGKKGREYVLKHHSLEVVGGIFSQILQKLGIKPSLSVKPVKKSQQQ